MGSWSSCTPGSCCLHSALAIARCSSQWTGESGLRFSVWEDWVVTANLATASSYQSIDDVLKNQQVNTGEPDQGQARPVAGMLGGDEV